MSDAGNNEVLVSPPVDANPPTPEVPKELDSAKWAAIAKKEQRLVHEQQLLKKRAEEISSREKELQTKLTPFQEFEALRAKDPVAALRSLGLSETDIFNWLANGEKKELTPEEKATKAAQDEIAKFKEEQNKREVDVEKAKEAEVITRFKGRIKTFLDANKAKYEACADYGEIAEIAAFQLVEQIAKDTGEVVSIDEAFQALEGFYDGEYERMSKYNKFKKVETVAEPVEEKKQPVSRGTTKTLTNAATPTIASTVKRKETQSEKRERLINQIKQTGLHR